MSVPEANPALLDILLDEAATCKDYLQVRQEGARRVQRSRKHYSPPMLLAIGYRVRSPRGVQLRQ